MIKLDVAHKKFIDHLKERERSDSTLIAYGKDISQLLEHIAKKGVELVDEITLEHLESFMDNLAKNQYTPKSISRKTNSTKTFFKFLKSLGHVTEDVAELLKHPKVDVKPPRILSKTEYMALRAASRDDTRTFAVIEVLLQTGLTISELAGIELTHMNLETLSLHIPRRNAKEARTVPLNKAVVEAVKSYVDDARPDYKESKHLFITKTGNPLLVRNIRSTIDRFFRVAGVENAKVNDLRHTFAAHHIKQGVNIAYVSKILGHKRVSTTERYLNYVKKEVDEDLHELGTL
jgi:integrase/recombinase XerD